LAIKTNPKNLSFAFRYLAAVMADNSDYASSIRILSEGLKSNPLDIDMLLNRAGYSTCLGDFQTALRDYDLCLKHRPDTYDAMKYRANTKFAYNNLEGAIKDYEAALRLDPEDSSVLNNCGIAYLTLGAFLHSSELFARVLNSTSAPAHIVEAARHNFALVRDIQTRWERLFSVDAMNIDNVEPAISDPMFVTDLVFEKDIESRMKEMTKAKITKLLKPPMEDKGFFLTFKEKLLTSFTEQLN